MSEIFSYSPDGHWTVVGRSGIVFGSFRIVYGSYEIIVRLLSDDTIPLKEKKQISIGHGWGRTAWVGWAVGPARAPALAALPIDFLKMSAVY